MAAYTKCNVGVGPLTKAINVATDSFYIALCSSSPVAATTFTAGTTDLATGGGYTQGGVSVTTTSSTVSGATPGVMTLILTSPAAWTASGGGFTFRYVLLYDSTANACLGFWDYGSNVTMNGTNGDTFTVTLDNVNGVFQVT